MAGQAVRSQLAAAAGRGALLAALLAVLAAVLLAVRGGEARQRRRIIVFECPGGTDKNSQGHRADTGPLLAAFAEAGFQAESVFFTDTGSERLLTELGFPARPADKPLAFVSRVDPGEYEDCTMERFYAFLRELAKAGVAAFNHPDDMEKMGQKRSLLRLRGLPIFVEDTLLYEKAAGVENFTTQFPGALLRSSSRVLKQNRGSKGEGIWWVSVQDPKGDSISDATPVLAVEAADNHGWETSLGDLLKNMTARYLVNDGDAIIDMPFLPRIAEGEIRLILSGRRVNHVVEKTPLKVAPAGKGGAEAFSANLDSGAKHVWLAPESYPSVVEPLYAHLEEMLSRMGVRNPPPLWTADFIRAGEPGTEATRFVLSEINANCVGFKAHPQLAHELVSSVAEALELRAAA